MSMGARLAKARRNQNLTQEQLAETLGVTRQAVAKWELGETTPDVLHCDALAELYGVSLDDLLHFEQRGSGPAVPPPPRGKHVFGVVQVGERGQIVIPKRAREIFRLERGATLVVLGDTNPGTAGIALVPAEFFTSVLELAGQIQEPAEKEGV